MKTFLFFVASIVGVALFLVIFYLLIIFCIFIVDAFLDHSLSIDFWNWKDVKEENFNACVSGGSEIIRKD